MTKKKRPTNGAAPPARVSPEPLHPALHGLIERVIVPILLDHLPEITAAAAAREVEEAERQTPRAAHNLPGPMGFDLDGRPLALSGQAVQARMRAAFDDPDSEVVAVLLRHHGDLLLQVMGPPSPETLRDIQGVLQQLVDGYAHILKGQ